MTGESNHVTSQRKSEHVRRSFVADLIDFRALENPSWRPSEKDKNYPSVEEMIQDIVEFRGRFEELKKSTTKDSLEKVRHESLTDFIFSLNREEDHGFGTREETEETLRNSEVGVNREISVEEQETLNIYQAYNYLEDTVQRECEQDESLYGFVESSMVKKLHRIILNNIPLSKGMTKPGECSNKERFTTFQGEIYFYRKPEDMEEAMNIILDRFNSLLQWLTSEKDESIRVYRLFKASSWLLFELLDLHPFSDGNGRLFRLLCSYTLSVVTPFPTPVYNVWCDSRTNEYHRALISARKSKMRHPEELTTLVIECNWYSWKGFLKKLEFQ